MPRETVISVGVEAPQPSGVPANAASARKAIDARSRSIARAAIEADALVGQLKGNKAFIGQATRVCLPKSVSGRQAGVRVVNSRCADRPTVTSSDTRRPVSGPDAVEEVILEPVDSMSGEGATVATYGRSRRLTFCRASRAVVGVNRFTTLECVAGARCALRPRGVRNDDGVHRLPESPRRCRLPAAQPDEGWACLCSATDAYATAHGMNNSGSSAGAARLR
jgi:hypothetical protein